MWLRAMNVNGRGFTSIEMLVAILIMVAVAGFGVQWSAGSRESARVTAMVDDLRKLAASEEAYYADHSTYYRGVLPSPALAFVPSPGVTMTVDAAGSTGWAATAAAVGTSRHCSALYGNAGSAGAVPAEEQTICAP
jgi:type II secretory pathway pseudopilin PulG